MDYLSRIFKKISLVYMDYLSRIFYKISPVQMDCLSRSFYKISLSQTHILSVSNRHFSTKMSQIANIMKSHARTVQIWIRHLSFALFFVPDPSKYLPGPQIPYKRSVFLGVGGISEAIKLICREGLLTHSFFPERDWSGVWLRLNARRLAVPKDPKCGPPP